MIPTLDASDFPAFFEALHEVRPFPWQTRLAAAVAETGTWPRLLELPTGSGKTATLDIAVFQLALEADRATARRAPVRIAFVVDRRLVVDDAFGRARRIAAALRNAEGGTVLGRVAARLRGLAVSAIPEAARAAFDPPPLIAARLRGGIPREDDWARTPVQPTVICTTVDQIGSRLLFRGYGVADASKPIHAGLIGSDCRLLLDEAHLAEPFRQTLGWVERYRGGAWRETEASGPWGVSVLTATPGETGGDVFALDDDDRADPVLRARLRAQKPARLIAPPKTKATPSDVAEEAEDAEAAGEAEAPKLVETLVGEALQACDRLKAAGLQHPAIGIVVNRVRRARQVFETLSTAITADPVSGEPAVDRILLIGPARPVDRDGLAAALDPIRTGASRDSLARPLFVVATQCIEAGVDIDLDGLVTEAAPLDALRQRFGRLNRAGRTIVPSAAIVASKADVVSRGTDPVYGTAIRETWAWLSRVATPGTKTAPATVDFGIEAFDALTSDASTAPPPELSAPRADAPVLMPAHLDLLTQTWPVPTASPDIGLHLHGPDRQPASVTVIWRADLAVGDAPDDVRRRLLVVPPRSAEAIELPITAVRAWLEGRVGGSDPLADIPQPVIEETGRQRGARRQVFRWAGDDDRSAWIRPDDLRPGITLIAPAAFGGVDLFGWNPALQDQATDVADAAAQPFDGRRFAVRIAPGLIEPPIVAAEGETAAERRVREAHAARVAADLAAALAETLAAVEPRDKAGLVQRLLERAWLPEALKTRLRRLQSDARGGWRAVDVQFDLYGEDEAGRPRGVVLVATRGVDGGGGAESEAVGANTTEDDVAGSIAARDLALGRHGADVGLFAEAFARAAGLDPGRLRDLRAAGLLHDLGKADPRFQAQLRGTDARFAALFGGPEDLLAKSARPLPRGERLPARRPQDELPPLWRHEALSVRLAPGDPAFADAVDADLVLWLIGTHHGRGRPLYPNADDLDAKDRALVLPDREARLPPGFGPQSLAYDRDGRDWAQLFEMLKARYGAWELARFEAVLRLADHRASEWAERRDETETDAGPPPVLVEAGEGSP